MNASRTAAARAPSAARAAEDREPGLPTRLAEGAVAGFVATTAMTVVMELLHRALPAHERHPLPPRHITERAGAAALPEGARRALTLIAHFGYGMTCGTAYTTLAPSHIPPVTTGVAYGLAVWAGSYLGLLPATGLYSATEETPRRNALMLAAHAVWGGTLGAVTHLLRQADRGGPHRD